MIVVFTGAAHGAEGDTERARELYEKARKAYELGLYDEAISEYTEAYKLRDDPAVLYNMAQAHRLAQHPVAALSLYRMYLIKVPQASNRAEVKAKIDALTKLLEDQKKAQDMPPDHALKESTASSPAASPSQTPGPAVEPAPRPPVPVPARAPGPAGIDRHSARSKKVAGLALGLVSVAVLSAGIGVAVLAKNASDELTQANQNRQRYDAAKYRTGKNEQIAAAGLLTVGAAAAVTAIVVGALGYREARADKVSLSAWIDRGSFVGSLTVRLP
jgi:hypothetical protein